MELRYDVVLAERGVDQFRKGDRTRSSLKQAAVEMLNERGFRDMRVIDVCERAGVSKATFWVYFTDKMALTTELLKEFIEDIILKLGKGSRPRTAYEAIYDANFVWIANIRANPGLMRCLLQLSDEVPEFAQLHDEADAALIARFSASMKKRFGEKMNLGPHFEVTLYALYGMMDSFTRSLISPHGSRLKDMVETAGFDDEQIAGFLSDLWFKALFGEQVVKA